MSRIMLHKLFFVNLLICLLFMNVGYTQDCKIKSTFKNPLGRVFEEDYKLPYLDLMESNKAEVQLTGNSGTLIVQFFFDETNKFKKSVDQFKKMLRDTFQVPSDINIIYKFQKTNGSIFINNGTDKFSIIHLNALFYSTDSLLLKELFGNGKLSRIDTTSTKLKKFTHEFIPISNKNDSELGRLYLFRAKLIGKGFACDPNEDLNILGIMKNIYHKKFVENCFNKQKEEHNRVQENRNAFLNSFQKRTDALNTNLSFLSPNQTQLAKFKYVKSETEWLNYSPKLPCYCYPEFKKENKSFILFNFKAFKILKNQQDRKPTTICNRDQWMNILLRIKSAPENSKSFNFEAYPGYFDQHWYKTEDASGYWLDTNSMGSFSKLTSLEPMIDTTISVISDSSRLNLMALSILKSNPLPKTKVNCVDFEKKWKSENIKYKNNQIKFIKNLSDWNKYSKNEPCCSFLNFDERNDTLGYVYNYKAYELLKDDPLLKNQRYKVALIDDWNTLIACSSMEYINLFTTSKDEDKKLNSIPRGGFFENGNWQLSEKGYSKFWASELDDATVIEFNFLKKEGAVNFVLRSTELKNRKDFSAYMIRFLKI